MKPNFIHIRERIISRLGTLSTDIKDYIHFNPKDFSWKCRWRMKFDRNPLFVEVSDKYKVKAYAEARGVRSAKTIYVTDQPETIPFDSLPDSYFIKATHGCGWNILCKDGKYFIYKTEFNTSNSDEMRKFELTRAQVLEKCKSWLTTVYSKRQWAYKCIKPLIMVEELFSPQYAGEELLDYKVYTFNGVAKVINILGPTIRKKNENVLLDPNWQEYILIHDKYNRPSTLPRKPDNLKEIIDSAEKLGKGIDFVRVDFYNTDKGIFLGEMTIYPEGGRQNSPSFDPEFNKWLGAQWILPTHQ